MSEFSRGIRAKAQDAEVHAILASQSPREADPVVPEFRETARQRF
jgi:hypothetical protein